MSGGSVAPRPRRKGAQAGPCPEGWTYYVVANGIGRDWVVESHRARLNEAGVAVKQRLFYHECDSPFEAGRTFERDIQLFRDLVVERRQGMWK